VRRAWVWLWLAACASGSSLDGPPSVESLGPGNGTTAEDGGGSTGGLGTSSAAGGTSSAAEGTSSAAEGSSGSPLDGCGNARVEPGEECDDGDDDPCNGCDGCLRRTFLVLDGGDGHRVEIADAVGAPLRLLDTPLTVEAWMRIDGDADDVEIMRRGAGNSGWRLGLRSVGVIATVFSGFDHTVDGVAPPGSGWHHVAWTYDLASSRLYLDGVPIGEQAASSAVLETDAPVRIGALMSGTGEIFGHTPGRIDEVHVSTVVRYPGPFVPVRRHEPDASTALLLHLDEGEGDEVIDASPSAHLGTAVGVSWALDDGYGRCG
jgi:hypothetical protein